MTTVNVIGCGRIGRPVADWLFGSNKFELLSVIGRHTLVWEAADVTIDTAGPAALRQFGPQLLEQGELWTVGASALADKAFRDELAVIARRNSNRLRLFTRWVEGVSLVPKSSSAKLHIAQKAPGIAEMTGAVFHGPLAEAASRFPDYLNTACAAALCGPGIENTTIELVCSQSGGPHQIHSRLEMHEIVMESTITFQRQANSQTHPVAAAVIAALESRDSWMVI